MLSHLRVLDLTDEWGLLAGSMLADLGADVVQIEPPGGSPARRLGPFANDERGPEQSLFWWGYARNKRGMVLDLDSVAGRTEFLDLVRSADCVLESFRPGYLEGLNLAYTDLARVNPRLVVTSVTPYGQTGPKSTWPATDLTVMSASGYQLLSGDEDRAPLRIAVPQSYAHASMDAVVGTLVALHERRWSGLGQHVDVSAQESAAVCCIPSVLARSWGDEPLSRTASGFKIGPLLFRNTYPAKDGHVSITFFFGNAIGPATKRLVDWIYEEGGCDESIRDKDYIAYAELLLSGKEPLGELERIEDTIASFTATRTKRELFNAAMARQLLIAPISTVADVRHDPHLNARGFFQPASPHGDGIAYPGPFVKFTNASLSLRRRAPRLGEHTTEIMADYGTSAKPVRQQDASGEAVRRPFERLKVVDLGWVMVEPSAMRVLADFGATVIKIETAGRIDTVRTLRPMKDGVPGPERSGPYHDFNAGKLGLALDLRKPQAQEIVRRLAAWADVVGESFTPRAMRGWGLHYEALREINPRLIYVSSCLGGQVGPYSHMAGYGNHGAALAGFNDLCGWKDRPPAGPNGPYTDYVTPKFITTAVIAALDYRDRTGLGQHIDISQMEAPVHFLTPAMLDYEVNGRVLQPDGNRHGEMAPHGVFPCLGVDRWVALAAEDDGQWQRLCAAMEMPGLASDARFASLASRKLHEDELEVIIAAWTAALPAEAVQERGVALGVPAHVVATADDLHNDPQLRHRDHFLTVPHPDLGDIVVEGGRFKLSRTPARIERPGPTYGQDASHVLMDILGYSSDQVAEIAAAGVLQ
ncbi:MAG: CoA transferase [Chloroflexi bacterium]|nr:CoA transferase [Chloroflexota bacterium]